MSPFDRCPGRTGRGVAEELERIRRGRHLDGTLSKAFAWPRRIHCRQPALIELLKYTSPGFVFSVGISPPVAAAAARAIDVMMSELPDWPQLRENGLAFVEGAKQRGLDTGPSMGAAVIPIIVGSSPYAS